MVEERQVLQACMQMQLYMNNHTTVEDWLSATTKVERQKAFMQMQLDKLPQYCRGLAKCYNGSTVAESSHANATGKITTIL